LTFSYLDSPFPAGAFPLHSGSCGHFRGHIALEKGEGVQLGGPDKSGKRQPRLTPGRENGNGGRWIFNIDDQSFSHVKINQAAGNGVGLLG